MGTFGDLGELGVVATWGPVDGVGAEEVPRVGTWTPSAIPPGEEILT